MTALVATVAGVSCMDVAPVSAPTATVHVALGAAAADVTGVEYSVTCASGETITQYVGLEEEGLPLHLSTELEGAPFADLFLVLEPGYCEVTATPMQSPLLASEQCSPAFASGFVTAEETAEWLMVIECAAPNTGALDVVTSLNHVPVITEVILNPGDTMIQCNNLGIVVETSDLDGDTVSVSIEVIPPVAGASYTLGTKPTNSVFTPQVAGIWTLVITASDGVSETQVSVDITVTPSNTACDGTGDSKS